MRILYVASLSPNGTAAHRMAALARLGHDPVPFDTDPVWQAASRWVGAMRFRLLAGPRIAEANRALLEAARRAKPDLAWMDKALFVRPETLAALGKAGIRTVHYNPDNPFGARGDPGWRLFRLSLPEFDAHLVPRESNFAEYRAAGARCVLPLPFAYEPGVHYPPPDGWGEADRADDVAFIGSPYDERADFVRALWRDHGIAVRLWGNGWRNRLDAAECRALYGGRPVYGDDYRDAIWRSRILLGFITHANRDTTARRCFEIAACGGFLLGERGADSLAAFEDGSEAAYFDDVAGCAAQISRYLADVPARERIAAAGRTRAVGSGYDNDSRLASVLDALAAEGIVRA